MSGGSPVGADRRCLLADDHPAVVAAIASLLEEQGLEIVGPAATAPEAVELARAAQPPLALVDLRMPGASGPELVRALAAAAPAMRIVVYTAEADMRLAATLLAEGAHALVLKEAPLEDLARALAVVSRGSCYLDAALAGAPFPRPTDAPKLTERERQVVELLADGHGYEQIAARLAMGVETVRTHVRKASMRLGAVSRTEMVAMALRLGLIS